MSAYAWSPDAIPFIISGLISVFLMVYALNKRSSAPLAGSFAWMSGLVVFWTFTYTPVLFSISLEDKLLWTRISYIGGQFAPFTLFIFILRQTRQAPWINRKLITTIGAIGLVLILGVLTDPLHHQLWQTTNLVNGELQNDGGPLFWLTLVYPYSLTIFSMVFLFRNFYAAKGVLRMQAAMFLLGMFIPILLSVMQDMLGLILIPHFDMTIFSLLITEVFFAVALFRFKALEFLPITFNAVVNNMKDGMLVFDQQYRVAFINPVAERILGAEKKKDSRDDAAKLLSVWSEEAWQKWCDRQPLLEITQGNGEYASTYSLDFSPLRDSAGFEMGTLLMIYDISERKRMEKRLETLAISDPLTGCFNRRHFMMLAEAELKRAQRYHHPLAAIMIDMDHFKQINDRYGHQAGDLVLQQMVEKCSKTLRGSDIFARYGGEEFVILLPETSVEVATQVAERIHHAIEGLRIETGQGEIRVSASLGVSCMSPNPSPTIDELLSQADSALYISKNTGRNRVTLYS